MSDHTPFLEESYEALFEIPGFPYLRVEPILLLDDSEEVKELWQSPQEELLFALHGQNGRLLVVSNHKISVYKIPQPKGFVRGAATFLFTMAVPQEVYDVMDAAGTVKDAVGAANSFGNWLSPKKRRQRAANKAAGMPNPKDIKGVTWKTKDEEIVALISCYRERILLENAFQWKLEKQLFWRTDEGIFPQIHIGENRITLTFVNAKGKVTHNTFDASTPIGLSYIAEYIAGTHLSFLNNHGWQAGLDEGVLLQDASFLQPADHAV